MKAVKWLVAKLQGDKTASFCRENERSRSYREMNQRPNLPWNSITHGILEPSAFPETIFHYNLPPYVSPCVAVVLCYTQTSLSDLDFYLLRFGSPSCLLKGVTLQVGETKTFLCASGNKQLCKHTTPDGSTVQS